MPRIVFVQPDGSTQEIEARTGESVMTTATSHLVPGIIGDCGGGLTCATCHVYVDKDWIDVVGRREGPEDEMLEMTSEESNEYSRLCCQIVVDSSVDGLVLTVPASQE
ncbi:2Fe-2S iron-sulfur cluster-binding protein [Streptomyces mexicanus]|jgi:2Fe-2S ferredoxin|uniref:2Fe-2S iron-sulfur cluster binding domain-containing protein n=1 Tax=Streptomyces mexicanus TaxID=178566 RepID=A0A7X1HZW1_9ACTN|nr:2Fe-2S iron-sulfur cluster-binding protein [Streptomyces mexicanus]MBC2864993.1 2Fe-2S iron-sulfur cluster binding domain-containing protein [Streptomyces mexicanus]